MSDYMFMLESHLSAEQHRVVGYMQELAGASGVNLYLTGGAMRDMLGGFPVRDLDFTVEANPAKLIKTAEKNYGVQVVFADELRKSSELHFPGGVTASLGMAHTERYPKSGGRPQVTPSTIHEDLRARDFTVNAIALSLNRASLGLPIDPTNGIGDIDRKEIRAVHNYVFYDDPARMLRLIRFKIRFGYTIDERTRLQYENAREAEMLQRIDPEALGAELRHMAREILSHDLVEALEQEKLIGLYSPALTGPKLNLATLQKLQKAHQMVPFGYDVHMHCLPLFLGVLTEKLNPKETAAFIKAAALTKAEAASVQKLATSCKKLERDLKGAKLQKPSLLYQTITKAPGEQVLYLTVYSAQRIVTDRIRNYFQKYLPAAAEVTDEMVAVSLGAAATTVLPGSPKFQRAKEEMILTRLDARPKKPAPVPEPAPPPPMSSFARGPGLRHAR